MESFSTHASIFADFVRRRSLADALEIRKRKNLSVFVFVDVYGETNEATRKQIRISWSYLLAYKEVIWQSVFLTLFIHHESSRDTDRDITELVLEMEVYRDRGLLLILQSSPYYL